MKIKDNKCAFYMRKLGQPQLRGSRRMERFRRHWILKEKTFFLSFFVGFVFDLGKFGKLIGNCSLLEREFGKLCFVLFLFLVVELELGGRKGSFGVAFLIMGCTVLTVLSTTGGCAENFSPKFKSMKQTGLDSLNLDWWHDAVKFWIWVKLWQASAHRNWQSLL